MTKAVIIFLFLIFFWGASIGQTRKDSLYVFIGEKISSKGFQSADTNKIPFDASIKAKYKIIENVYRHFQKDTIEFEAYDHFGNFDFLNYKYGKIFFCSTIGAIGKYCSSTNKPATH